ncbi:MAG: TlpA family protein disulfide reductase [Flavipsychrobacter sp.]|nr:TlpA family protein disulfide reductase [Flavipsychrobacter sp.]
MKNFLVFALLAVSSIGSLAQDVSALRFAACVNKPDLKPDFYRGKFLVLDLWATWCGPCIGSFPQVIALEKKYEHNENIVFATLTAERKGKIDSFVEARRVKMPLGYHLVDASGASWKAFGISLIPEILVFAPSGKMVFRGRIEQLTGAMDRLLAGEVIMPARHNEETVTSDRWKDYAAKADFLALVSDAVGGQQPTDGSSVYKGKVRYQYSGYPLKEVISYITDVPTLRIVSDDSARSSALIDLCYRQSANSFPEFDSGLFTGQAQNHAMHVLAGSRGFRVRWVDRKTAAWEIVVEDSSLFAKAITLSTGGSYSSVMDRAAKKYNYVNQPVSAIASLAEDELQDFYFTTITNVPGRDFIMSCASHADFAASLKQYGLKVNRVPSFNVRMLELSFK